MNSNKKDQNGYRQLAGIISYYLLKLLPSLIFIFIILLPLTLFFAICYNSNFNIDDRTIRGAELEDDLVDTDGDGIKDHYRTYESGEIIYIRDVISNVLKDDWSGTALELFERYIFLNSIKDQNVVFLYYWDSLDLKYFNFGPGDEIVIEIKIELPEIEHHEFLSGENLNLCVIEINNIYTVSEFQEKTSNFFISVISSFSMLVLITVIWHIYIKKKFKKNP